MGIDSAQACGRPSVAQASAAPSAPGANRSSVTLQRSTGKPWLAGATVTVALLVLATLLWAGREPGTGPGRTSPALAVPLTAYPGDERAPSLSPDGSRVAFSWDGPARNNYDIYVKLAGPGEPIRLTTNPAPDESPAFSPDGRSVAFMRFASANAAAYLVVIPAQGGAERTIATIFPMPIKPSTPTSNLSFDAGRTLACLWRGDISRRPARHLVDGRRWLGAPPPDRRSGRRTGPESDRVAGRRVSRVCAAAHRGPLRSLCRAADVRCDSKRHTATAHARQRQYSRICLGASEARDRVFGRPAPRSLAARAHPGGAGRQSTAYARIPHLRRTGGRTQHRADRSARCMRHNPETQPCTSLRFEIDPPCRLRSPPSTRRSTNIRLTTRLTGSGWHSRRPGRERRKSGLRTGMARIRCR